MNEYVYHGTERLRCGYTTGSCAAAAAKAAAEMLLSGDIVQNVDLLTPAGIRLKLEVQDICMGHGFVSCAIQKDSGDDPDVTKGIFIYARVSKTEQGVEITGGEGIGTVTKPGLDQPVGASAINSVPRRMITEAVQDVSGRHGYSGGFRVVISAPQGMELAQKTFNPRMGIIGGISIIGTTGIVEPMSSRALVETIRAEAGMRRAAGYKNLLLAVGNYSEQFLKMQDTLPLERSVLCSNFIGDALDIGVSLGFEKILLVGHIGKLVKLGSGIMNTHSSYADGRMETLIACGALAGVQGRVLQEIAGCITTDAALDVLYRNNAAGQTLSVLVQRIETYMKLRVRDTVPVGAVIFSGKHELVLKTALADGIIRAISAE